MNADARPQQAYPARNRISLLVERLIPRVKHPHPAKSTAGLSIHWPRNTSKRSTTPIRSIVFSDPHQFHTFDLHI
jgi:hypothetical protein